jgi:putative lipoic acid-binding regulatory protein
MESGPSEELLADSHEFPGVYQFKVIGSASDDFQTRVLDVVTAEVASSEAVRFTVRETRGGKHLAITLHVNVESPRQVRSIYERIRDLEGVLLLL